MAFAARIAGIIYNILGKTGVGKSTLLSALLRQDLLHGEGIVLLDPHGQLVEDLIPLVQHHRSKDLIYLNPADPASQLTFNPLTQVPAEKRSLACSGILDIFKQRWPDFWGPRTEHLLRHCLLTLLELPFSTLADILRLFEEPVFVPQVLPYIGNAQVRRFWEYEYLAYTARFRTEAISPIQNKLGSFLADSVLRRLLGQSSSSFNLRQIMDEGKVLLVNLPQGRLGSDHVALLGGLLLSQLCVTGLTRADSGLSGSRLSISQ